MLTTAIGGAAAVEAHDATARTTPPRRRSIPLPVVQPSVTDNLGAMLEGQVRVIADKSTNKLIVMSSGRDYLAIKDVVRELDQPRRQVYVEAVILEVNVDDDLEAGTSSHGGTTTSNGNAARARRSPDRPGQHARRSTSRGRPPPPATSTPPRPSPPRPA